MKMNNGHFGSHDAVDCAEEWGLNFEALAEWFQCLRHRNFAYASILAAGERVRIGGNRFNRRRK
jgi:hypothetical protein